MSETRAGAAETGQTITEERALTTPATTVLNTIVALAKDPSVDVTKLEALLGMQERMERRQAEAEFFQALRAAQQAMPRVKKNGTIQLGKDKDSGQSRGAIPFATYEDVDAVVRPIMERFGFSVTFSEAESGDKGIRWSATHRHMAGHAETNFLTLPADNGPGRNPLQARGSTNSYAKRYLMEDFYNIVREGADDDGKRGGKRYIKPEEADELSALCKEVGRQEGQFLDSMFGGTIRSFDEMEPGAGYLAARNMLMRMHAAQRKGKE